MDYTEALQDVLLEQIPLTEAMSLKVIHASPLEVLLRAPLEPNHNHKDTAFGGSLYSLAVLAGWSLLWIRLKEAGLEGHVVIAKSEVEYLKPVTDDFEATAVADEGVIATALDLYRRKGRARVMVRSRIGALGDEAVMFLGTYALVR